MEEFIKYVFGGSSAAWWGASSLFALIGIVFSLAWQVKTRDKSSPRTPYKFNMYFFVIDNVSRFLVTVITCFIFLRFYSELTGQDINMFFSFGIGLGSDKLSEFLKNNVGFLKSKIDVSKDENKKP